MLMPSSDKYSSKTSEKKSKNNNVYIERQKHRRGIIFYFYKYEFIRELRIQFLRGGADLFLSNKSYFSYLQYLAYYKW